MQHQAVGPAAGSQLGSWGPRGFKKSDSFCADFPSSHDEVTGCVGTGGAGA